MWNNAGTIAVTQGGKAILGTGTNFIKQREGWLVWIFGEARPHEIDDVVSSSEIALVDPVEMASASGVNFLIIPTQGLNQRVVEKVEELIASFTGSQEAWSLIVSNFSASVYQLWLDEGNTGTVSEFFATLKGDAGASAYEEWEAIAENNGQTFAQYQAFLKGAPGDDAFAVWLAAGNTGDVDDYHDSLSQGAVSATAANKTAAQTAQGASEAARDLAQAWASELEGVEVSGGLFSALHHAAKAALSATSAATSLTSAQGVLTSIQAIFDNFDDRYLGSFATADQPALDNDGDALQVGAMYLNTDEDELRFWNGAQWKSPEATAEAAAAAALASQTATAASEGNASGSATAAAAAEVKAGKWAAEAEDVEVEAGKYSAAHHAAKAEGWAAFASLAVNATSWVSEGAYVKDQNVWSLLDNDLYHCLADHSGSTVDPSQDAVNWAPGNGGPHTHVIADVTGLQGALDGKASLVQGGKADTATQPGDLSTVATSGDYADLSNKPAILSPIAFSIIFGS